MSFKFFFKNLKLANDVEYKIMLYGMIFILAHAYIIVQTCRESQIPALVTPVALLLDGTNIIW